MVLAKSGTPHLRITIRAQNEGLSPEPPFEPRIIGPSFRRTEGPLRATGSVLFRPYILLRFGFRVILLRFRLLLLGELEPAPLFVDPGRVRLAQENNHLLVLPLRL